MRIIVNHLTRMGNSRICVAGIDSETFDHVRPVTPPSDLITRDLLREHGGPFRVGALVDLGDVRAQPSPPESEDHTFVTHRARHVEDLSEEEYLAVLDEVSDADLSTAFGPGLEQLGDRKYAIEAGSGERSLAVIPIRGQPRLRTAFGKLRLELSHPDAPASLGVTDVRFYESDHTTIRDDVVDDVNRRLASGVDAYAMVGLARAFYTESYARTLHWLQINGLCLADRPVGDWP